MIVFAMLLGITITGLLVAFDFWHCRARPTHPSRRAVDTVQPYRSTFATTGRQASGLTLLGAMGRSVGGRKTGY